MIKYYLIKSIKIFNNNITISLILFLSTNLYAQNFYVGFSKSSINPDNTILSSPLSGFGDPRAGRFSIDFLEAGHANNVVSMCSSPTKLYAVTSDIAYGSSTKLWTRDLTLSSVNWVLMASASNVTAITYGNGKLYASDKNNVLWMMDANTSNSLWTNIGQANSITGLTFLNNKLYATDRTNKLWITNAIPNNIVWNFIGHAIDIRSLTNDGTNLIGISKGLNELWIRNTLPYNQDWTKMGTNNGITFDIYISNITYTNNTLYSTSTNNKLYYSNHNQKPINSSVTYFEKGIEKALVVTLDLCGIDYSFSKEIKSKIKQQFNINEKSILINCSHTHFAPIAQNYFCMQEFYQKPNINYLLIVKNAILSAVENSIFNKVESKLMFSKGKTCIGYNRADSSKGLDDNITMVTSKNLGSEIINGLILSASCHPVWSEDAKDKITISSNYIGLTKTKLGILKNSNNLTFMQGCAGDINPISADTPESTSNKLSTDFNNLNVMSEITGNIITKFDSISIPINNFTYQHAIDTKNANIYNSDQTSERNVRWANRIINQYDTNTLPSAISIYIQIFKIGDWNIVALSREAVSQYAIDLYSQHNNSKLTVLGYSNDVASYLPVDWHIEKTTVPNYEGLDSFYLYGQSGIPVINVKDLVLAKINSMLL